LIKSTSELLKISSANATGDEDILANDEEDDSRPPNKNRTALEILDDKTVDQPAIVCLDKTLHLGKVKPSSTVTANLKMIATREGLF